MQLRADTAQAGAGQGRAGEGGRSRTRARCVSGSCKGLCAHMRWHALPSHAARTRRQAPAGVVHGRDRCCKSACDSLLPVMDRPESRPKELCWRPQAHEQQQRAWAEGVKPSALRWPLHAAWSHAWKVGEPRPKTTAPDMHTHAPATGCLCTAARPGCRPTGLCGRRPLRRYPPSQSRWQWRCALLSGSSPGWRPGWGRCTGTGQAAGRTTQAQHSRAQRSTAQDGQWHVSLAQQTPQPRPCSACRAQRCWARGRCGATQCDTHPRGAALTAVQHTASLGCVGGVSCGGGWMRVPVVHLQPTQVPGSGPGSSGCSG
jgi:hypothetical protein